MRGRKCLRAALRVVLGEMLDIRTTDPYHYPHDNSTQPHSRPVPRMARHWHLRRGETPQQERLVITMTTRTYHTPTYYRVRTLVRCAFLAGVALTAFLVGKALASDPYPYECDRSAVIVTSGDTLWSLAEKHCTGHVGAATAALVARYGADVQVGDIISLALP